MHTPFRHREGFCLSVLYTAGIFILNLLPQKAKPFILLSLALLFAVFVLLRRKKRFFAYLSTLLLILALATVPSLIYDKSDDCIEPLSKQNAYVTVTVYDVSYSSDSICYATGMLNSLNGEETRVKIKFSSTLSGVTAGDVLSGCAYIEPIERGDESGIYLLSRNIRYSLTVYDAQREGTSLTPSVLAAKARAYLTAVIEKRVPSEPGALLSALLLGEREGLSDSFRADMNRLGTSHMLALSGLHLSVLLLGIERLLTRLHIDKRCRYATVAALTLCYLFLTGFPVSAVRAGVMLLFVFLNFFLRREHDSTTALGLAVGLICTLQPFSALDSSLWLSAFATFGILLFLERENKNLIHIKEYSLIRELCSYISLSVKITLSATLATLPLTAYMFGKLPLLSVFANLIFAPLMHFLLIGAILVLALGWISLISLGVSFVAQMMIYLSSLLSAIPNTQITLDNPFVLAVFMLCVVLLFLYVGFCPKKLFLKRVPVCILLCTALILSSFYGVRFLANINTLTVQYATTSAKNGDFFILKENGSTAVIDSTLSSKKYFGEIHDAMLSLGECEIDAYIFTSYSSSFQSAIEELLGSYTVHRIYLPSPQNKTERELFDEIKANAETRRVKLSEYTVGKAITVGNASFTLHYRTALGAGDSRTYFSLLYGEHSLAYLSAGMLTPYNTAKIKKELAETDGIFFGSFGTKNEDLFENISHFTKARVYAGNAAAVPAGRIDGVQISDTHLLKWK